MHLNDDTETRYSVQRVIVDTVNQLTETQYVVVNRLGDEIASFKQEEAANEYAALRNKRNG